MIEFEFNLPSIRLYNSDTGIGFDLTIDENFEEGKFTLLYSFPEQWYPNLLGYNR